MVGLAGVGLGLPAWLGLEVDFVGFAMVGFSVVVVLRWLGFLLGLLLKRGGGSADLSSSLFRRGGG